MECNMLSQWVTGVTSSGLYSLAKGTAVFDNQITVHNFDALGKFSDSSYCVAA